MLDRLGPTQRAELAPQVRTLLATGDLTGALALIAPALLGGPAIDSTAFQQRIAGVVQTLQAPAQRLRHRPAMRVLAQTRSVVSLGTATALAALGSLFLVLLLGAGALTRAAGGRWVRMLVITLAASRRRPQPRSCCTTSTTSCG
jgi:hypothetical protein